MNLRLSHVLEEDRWQRSVQIPHPERLAFISAKNSRWARERARAAALFLEQDVMQDFEEKTSLQPPRPRRGLTVEQAQEPPIPDLTARARQTQWCV